MHLLGSAVLFSVMLSTLVRLLRNGESKQHFDANVLETLTMEGFLLLNLSVSGRMPSAACFLLKGKIHPCNQ